MRGVASRVGWAIAGAGALLMAAAAPAQDILGPAAAACAPGAEGPALLVRVYGFKQRTGMLRVQTYGSNPEDFLAKGKRLDRIDLPVTAAGDMTVCVPVAATGNYAVAVRHDVNGNNKSGDWSDGGGFSGNPDISLTRLKPRYQDVAVSVRPGVTLVDVVLNYRSGLSIQPLADRR